MKINAAKMERVQRNRAKVKVGQLWRLGENFYLIMKVVTLDHTPSLDYLVVLSDDGELSETYLDNLFYFKAELVADEC